VNGKLVQIFFLSFVVLYSYLVFCRGQRYLAQFEFFATSVRSSMISPYCHPVLYLKKKLASVPQEVQARAPAFGHNGCRFWPPVKQLAG